MNRITWNILVVLFIISWVVRVMCISWFSILSKILGDMFGDSVDKACIGCNEHFDWMISEGKKLGL